MVDDDNILGQALKKYANLPDNVVVQDFDGYSTFLVSPAACIICVQTMNQSCRAETVRSQR